MKKIGFLFKSVVIFAFAGFLLASCSGGISDPIDLQSFIDSSGTTVNLSEGGFVLGENESIIISGAQSITGGESKFDMKGATITVKAAGVSLSNLTNVSEIIVASEVGDGDFTIDSSDVTKLTVNGGGANSVHIKNVAVTSVSVSKDGVRIVLEGATTVTALEIKANCALDKDEGSTAVVASLTVADNVTKIEFKATITVTNVEKMPENVTIEAPEGVKIPESVTKAKENAAGDDNEKDDGNAPESDTKEKENAAGDDNKKDDGNAPESDTKTYYMDYDDEKSENCAVGIPLPGNPKYKKGDYVHVHLTGKASNNLPVIRFSLTQTADSFGWARLTNELRKEVSVVKDTAFSIDYNFKVVKDYFTDEDAESDLYLCYDAGVVGYTGDKRTTLTDVKITCEKLTTTPEAEPLPHTLYFGIGYEDDGKICYDYYFDNTKGLYTVNEGDKFRVTFSGTPDRDVTDAGVNFALVQNNSNGDSWGDFGGRAWCWDSYSFKKDVPFVKEFYLIAENGRNQNPSDDFYSYISMNTYDTPFIIKNYSITVTKVDSSNYGNTPSKDNRFAIGNAELGTSGYRKAVLKDNGEISWNQVYDYQEIGWCLMPDICDGKTGIKIKFAEKDNQQLSIKIRPLNNTNNNEACYSVPDNGECTAWFNGYGRSWGNVTNMDLSNGLEICIAAESGNDYSPTQIQSVELLTESLPVCPEGLKFEGVEFGSFITNSNEVKCLGNTVTWFKDNTDGGCGWNLSGIDLSSYKKVRIYISSNTANNLSISMWDTEWQNGCAYNDLSLLGDEEKYVEASLSCESCSWTNKDNVSIDLTKGLILYLQSPCGVENPREVDQTTVITKIEFLTE